MDCKSRMRRGALTGAALFAALWAGQASAGTCLTNPTDQVGNPIFAATVGTFIGLGVDPNVTCIENGLWADPVGFSLGNYVKGAEGLGGGPTLSTTLSFNGANLGSFAANANARDFYWVQDTGNQTTINGAIGGRPSQGIIWDLGVDANNNPAANQVAVFVYVDHGPVPGEVLENSVWLSNDPNAADATWTLATLDHVYGGGWSPDPDIADGFVTVFRLPNNAEFRYVSVTWGGPGAVTRDGDNEIDAVGGLRASGAGIQCGGPGQPPCPTPEPAPLAGFGFGLALLGIMRRRRAG